MRVPGSLLGVVRPEGPPERRLFLGADQRRATTFKEENLCR
jgi:hypothetical protein